MKTTKILMLIVLFFTSSVSAEKWQIAEFLTIDPADSIDVTYQEIPELEMEGEFVTGWKGEDLSYFLIVEKQEENSSFEVIWPFVRQAMNQESSDGKSTIVNEGKLKTNSGNEVSYKTIQYNIEEGVVTQLFTFIQSKKKSYWIIGTTVDEDIKYMTENSLAIMKTATVTQ